MTTQLSLISVPAQAQGAGDPPLDRTDDGTGRSRATGDAAAPPRDEAPPLRRSTGHAGWLDRRTISSGRRGVAAARAALAAANERVARRESDAEIGRQRDLMRLAGDRHAA